ncbi:MAG: DUF1579 family protein [Chthonomonadaceae bacterium]|nr:DUF1579 family protein [Chthonomonadaceae bacterium]
MRPLLACLSLSILTCFAHAQLPDLPGPEKLQELKWLEGTWTGKTTFKMDGNEAPVKLSLVFSMESQFLKCVSLFDFEQIHMKETMYVGYDDEKKSFFAYTFSNFAAQPRVEHGDFVSDALTLISDPWNVMGNSMTSRTVIKKVSDTKATMSVEFKVDDKWDQALSAELAKS